MFRAFAAALLLAAASAEATIIVDDFEVAPFLVVGDPQGELDQNQLPTTNVFGGSRRLDLTFGSAELVLSAGDDAMVLTGQGAHYTLRYILGLSPVDISQGGTNDRIEIEFADSIEFPGSGLIDISYPDAAHVGFQKIGSRAVLTLADLVAASQQLDPLHTTMLSFQIFVNGSFAIQRIRIVPEPGSALLLLSASMVLASVASRRGQRT